MKSLLKFLANVSISLFSVSITLVFVEIGVRVYLRATNVADPDKINTFNEMPKDIHLFDKQLGWVLAPNYRDKDTYVNSIGFRSSQEFQPKNDTTDTRKKIFVLGDSMVFGVKEEQDSIFTEVLNRDQKDMLFINTGVVGYNTVQEYLTLENHINDFNIDMVVLFYTEANDMIWNARPGMCNPYCSLKKDSLVFHAPDETIKLPFYKKLAAYKFLDKKVLQGKDFNYIFQKIDFNLFKGNSQTWTITRKMLKSISSLCKNNNIKLMIVDIPTDNQIINKADVTRQELLKQLCEEEGVIYYDLLDYYPPDCSNLFIPNDSHWNARGHRFISNFLSEKINPQKL
ncbi:MAG: SGNH/GDSL hydrolase family protein [Lewinellaceae bacterium]|nr:SGNH/GDSL hydrolase family protein [Lewinellaceae bacterium]